MTDREAFENIFGPISPEQAEEMEQSRIRQDNLHAKYEAFLAAMTPGQRQAYFATMDDEIADCDSPEQRGLL